MRDLVVLVPDKNTEFAVRGAIRREKALGIRSLDCKVIVEPGRDGGVRRRGVQILSVERRQFGHGLLIFDYEGSGANGPAAATEAELDEALRSGWGDRGKAIVIEPEVDIWMWGAETHLKDVVGWSGAQGIRDWLSSKGFVFSPQGKPLRPKEALEEVFREARIPRSSAQYESLAGRLSMARCQDAAFHRLHHTLVQWFGQGA